jgi:hypothetical protein
MADVGIDKIWANSGDSHIIEPPDLFDSLPDDVRERMPRSVKDPSGAFETIYIDGQEFRRDLPKPSPHRKGVGINARPSGSKEEDFINRMLGGNDPARRLEDLDEEGVWGEVIYPSFGIWTFNIRTPRVVKEGARVLNEFALDFQNHPPPSTTRWPRSRAPTAPGSPAASSRPDHPSAVRSGTTRSGTRCGPPSPRLAW